jgi:DUF4097 and DUF4098 domain-containing protein YvlB
MSSVAAPTVRISGGSSRVEVTAKEGGSFRLEGSADVVEDGHQVTISQVRSRLSVTVAAGTHLVIGTTSGRVDVTGRVGNLAVVTMSGRVQVESAASVDIRTQSSRVEVGSVAGSCRVRSTSGKVEVGACGDADISARSGRIELQRVDGEVDAHSISGRIDLSMASANDVRAETVTGRIEVSLPKNTVAYQPPKSAPQTLRPPNCDCTVVARSTTGKVVVTSR